MKVDICSHRNAAALLSEQPKTYDVILIFNPGGRYDNEDYLTAIRQHANRICELEFDDVEFPRDRHQMPEARHVRSAVDFAADKEQLVVTCTAGMSRSAALAYVVACTKMDPVEAVKVLDPNRHTPNEKVVFLGYDFLGRPAEMLEAYARFKDEMSLRYRF